MDLPFIDAADVARLLPYEALVDELAAGHRADPPVARRLVFGPDDASQQSFLALPAWQPGSALGVKLVTVFPGNPPAGRASVQAVYVLFDGAHGSPLALIDGTELTYRKTAADSALGARFLAREDARDVADGRRRWSGPSPRRRPPGGAPVDRAGAGLEPHP